MRTHVTTLVTFITGLVESVLVDGNCPVFVTKRIEGETITPRHTPSFLMSALTRKYSKHDDKQQRGSVDHSRHRRRAVFASADGSLQLTKARWILRLQVDAVGRIRGLADSACVAVTNDSKELISALYFTCNLGVNLYVSWLACFSLFQITRTGVHLI